MDADLESSRQRPEYLPLDPMIGEYVRSVHVSEWDLTGTMETEDLAVGLTLQAETQMGLGYQFTFEFQLNPFTGVRTLQGLRAWECDGFDVYDDRSYLDDQTKALFEEIMSKVAGRQAQRTRGTDFED